MENQIILFHRYIESQICLNRMFMENKKVSSTMPIYVEQHLYPQLKDLITKYKPDLIWHLHS